MKNLEEKIKYLEEKEEEFKGEGKKPERLRERVIRYPGGVKREKYYVEEDRKSKNTVGGTLFGILFLIWFVGSIVFMIRCFGNEENTGLGAAVFGQLFLGFGIVALCSKQKIGAIFAVVGGAMCGGGLLYHFGNAQIQTELVERLIPVVLCSVFVLVGVGMLFGAYMNFLKKKRCTLPIITQSTYIDREIIHITKGSGDNSRTVPVLMWVSYFQYYFNGKYYYADCEAIPATHPKPSLGDSRDIYINPDKPEEYWSKSTNRFEAIILLVLGMSFAAAGGSTLYLFLANI